MRAFKVMFGDPSGKPADIDLNIIADGEIREIEEAIRESRFDEVNEGASTWRAPWLIGALKDCRTAST